MIARHVIGAIRRRWPKIKIVIRGDSHYARHEAMTWCERNHVGYIFGLAGNKTLLCRIATLAEGISLTRVEGEVRKGPPYGAFRYAAKSCDVERQVIARIEASPKAADSHLVVTNLAGASP